MTWKRRLGLLLFGIACPGCSPFVNSVRTVVLEPIHYPWRVALIKEDCRNADLADAAFTEYFSTHADVCQSVHFSDGFKEGFKHYLLVGGNGEPPPIPPRNYWGPEFQTPQGHQAIAEWFTGYHAGASVARHSGYRDLVTVPVSDMLPPAVPPVEPQRAPIEVVAPVSELPLPRVMPSE